MTFLLSLKLFESIYVKMSWKLIFELCLQGSVIVVVATA